MCEGKKDFFSLKTHTQNIEKGKQKNYVQSGSIWRDKHATFQE